MTATAHGHHPPAAPPAGAEERLPGEMMAEHHDMARWVDVVPAIGGWLMAAPGVLGHDGGIADSDRVVGSLVVTFALVALAEVARPLRLLNVPLGAWLLFAPLIFGASAAVTASGMIAGVALVVLSLPRGAIVERSGGWETRVR